MMTAFHKKKFLRYLPVKDVTPQLKGFSKVHFKIRSAFFLYDLQRSN